MKGLDSPPTFHTDLRACWQRGESVRIEDYLALHPGLAADPECLLDLIYQEVILREENGESPVSEDYYRRFPDLADQLRPVFEVHKALDNLPAQHSDLDVPARHVETLPPEAPTIPGYDVLSELGRGGGGVVYRARQRGLDRLVAVKVLAAAAAASPAKRARFHAEAQLVARLQHPNIVQVFEVGELKDGRPFFVMEHIEGGSLAPCTAGIPQPAKDAARLVVTIARAVHFAHQKGIVHRDLKPGNVLLQLRSAEGDRRHPEDRPTLHIKVDPQLERADLLGSTCRILRTALPKVADFGLAKNLDEANGASRTGDVMGTPSYMAPEQARGQVREVGPRTDVYALGAILYELLTGRPPFQAATSLETLRLVLEEEPVPLERLRGKTPRDLQTICLKCLHKEPAGRYATAVAFADDLERFLDGRPILARPVTRLERAVRWTRRHPSTAALAVLLVAAAVAFGLIWQLGVAREQQRLGSAREEIQVSLREGQRAFGQRDWSRAQSRAAVVLERLNGEPRLQSLRPEADDLFAEASRRLTVEASERANAAALRDFRRQHDRALFHGLISYAGGTLITGRADMDHLRESQEAAARALALAGTGLSDARFGDQFRHGEIADDCYALLLLTAGSANDGQAALRSLEQAAVGRPATRAYHQRRAHLLEMIGDRASAATALQQAEAMPPVTAFDHFLVGQESFRRGELSAARRAFEEAVALQKDHFWAQCFLAVCSLRQGRPSEARAALTVCVTLRPDFVWTWLMHGYAQRELRAFAGAEADFQRGARLLENEPNTEARYVLLINRGVLRFEEAEAAAHASTAGVVARSAGASLCLTAPVELIAPGADRLREAAADLEEAERLRPDLYAAPLDLANVYRWQGRRAEAQQALARGFRLGPPPEVQAAVRIEQGRYLFAQGHVEAAASLFEAAAGSVNHPAGALLGQAQVLLGRHQEAVQTFDNYLARGGMPSVDVYRGRGLARLRLGQFADAVADFNRALDRRPDAELHLQRGWAYFFLDAWALAGRDFDEAIRLGLTQPDAWAGRGLARVMLGTYREAVADAEEAQRRNPSTAETYHNVACVYALAASRADVDATEKEHLALAARSRACAVAAVRQALDLVPAQRQVAFWRDKVFPDRALDAIRATAEFRLWEAEYGPSRAGLTK